MTESIEFYELAAKMRDMFNGVAEAWDAFVQQQSKAVLKEYDPEKIKWLDKTGQKGPFQCTDDVDNPEYKALRQDLKEHGEFLTFKGFRYWIFTSGITVGRKPVKQ